jgi:hypothetical protein
MSDLRPATIAVNLTLIVLTSLAISCRIGRKVKMLSTFGWHDGMFSPLIASLHRTNRYEALATFAGSCAIVLSIIQMYATRLGAGLHEADIDPDNMEMLLKVRYSQITITRVLTQHLSVGHGSPNLLLQRQLGGEALFAFLLHRTHLRTLGPPMHFRHAPSCVFLRSQLRRDQHPPMHPRSEMVGPNHRGLLHRLEQLLLLQLDLHASLRSRPLHPARSIHLERQAASPPPHRCQHSLRHGRPRPSRKRDTRLLRAPTRHKSRLPFPIRRIHDLRRRREPPRRHRRLRPQHQSRADPLLPQPAKQVRAHHQ